MSIAASVNRTVERFEPGRIFGYSDLAPYQEAPGAVVRALSRLAQENKVTRVAKGRYCKPKQGLFGALKPTDNELLRDTLYRDGRLRGYVTGPALYNRLGLTTQIPKTVTVAFDGARQEKDFGTIRIKTVPSRAPIRKADVPLLQFLDVLRDVKNVPDANPGEVLAAIAERFATLSVADVNRLQKLALSYYNAGTRALVGLLLTRNGQRIDPKLQGSLNPLTRFRVGLDADAWRDKTDWYIQ